MFIIQKAFQFSLPTVVLLSFMLPVCIQQPLSSTYDYIRLALHLLLYPKLPQKDIFSVCPFTVNCLSFLEKQSWIDKAWVKFQWF